MFPPRDAQLGSGSVCGRSRDVNQQTAPCVPRGQGLLLRCWEQGSHSPPPRWGRGAGGKGRSGGVQQAASAG